MNPRYIKLAVMAGFGVVYIHDLVASHRNKRVYDEARHATENLIAADRMLIEALEDMTVLVNTAQERVDYLTAILDEHEIPVTEFDRIVFNDLDNR